MTKNNKPNQPILNQKFNAKPLEKQATSNWSSFFINGKLVTNDFMNDRNKLPFKTK